MPWKNYVKIVDDRRDDKNITSELFKKVPSAKIPNDNDNKINTYKEEFDLSLHKIIKLSDQNSMLNSQLKSLQRELLVVRRQCKVQDARLSKAINMEVAPTLVQRLTLDVQNLTVLNREKSHKCENLERQLSETKSRLEIANRHLSRLQEIILDLKQNNSPSIKEYQKVCDDRLILKNQKTDLEHKLCLLERTIKHRGANWLEKLKKLKIQLNEKDQQMENLNKILMEKNKHLNQYNIYSQRFRFDFCSQKEGCCTSISDNYTTTCLSDKRLKKEKGIQADTETHSSEPEIISPIITLDLTTKIGADGDLCLESSQRDKFIDINRINEETQDIRDNDSCHFNEEPQRYISEMSIPIYDNDPETDTNNNDEINILKHRETSDLTDLRMENLAKLWKLINANNNSTNNPSPIAEEKILQKSCETGDRVKAKCLDKDPFACLVMNIDNEEEMQL